MNYFRNETNDNATVVFVEQGAFLCVYERDGQSLDVIAKWCGLCRWFTTIRATTNGR